PWNFRWLLRLGRKGKRKEHGAQQDCGFGIAECGFQGNAGATCKLIKGLFAHGFCSVSKFRPQSRFCFVRFLKSEIHIPKSLDDLSALATTFGESPALVLEDLRKEFLRCGPRPHIGSLIGRIVGRGEAMMSAAVELQLPIDLGLAQLLDREIELRKRRGRVFSAV